MMTNQEFKLKVKELFEIENTMELRDMKVSKENA